ncbi:MAG: lipoprotein-releasing system permease protein, partial [Acidobacteriota bacterium]|nr:lipoprotein-releasing system permease protein [Acidobacteriota bacterium]
MRLETSIAKRYLWNARKQRHTAFLSSISILGLAVGVAALLISIALLSGLQGQIKRQLIASSPQVLAEPKGQHTIDDADAIVALAAKLGMTDIQPFISGIGYGGNQEDGRGRPVHIRSYRPGAPPKPERRARPVKLDPDIPRVFVTPAFASSLSLGEGNSLTIIAPRARLTPFGPVPVWKKYQIAGLVIPSESQS